MTYGFSIVAWVMAVYLNRGVFHVKAAKHLRESVHAFEYNQMSPVLFTANFTDRENA